MDAPPPNENPTNDAPTTIEASNIDTSTSQHFTYPYLPLYSYGYLYGAPPNVSYGASPPFTPPFGAPPSYSARPPFHPSTCTIVLPSIGEGTK
jgi:hypothetical protein